MSAFIEPTYKEQKSFFYFLFLVLMTAFFVSKETFSDSMVGVLTTLWGLFGFYRYIYLSSEENRKLPKILTLPSRILFGFNQQQDKKTNLIVTRFLKIDIMLWVVTGCLFVLWGLHCSFYPTDTSFIDSFWESKKSILNNERDIKLNYYPIIQNISYYFMVALITYIGVSYAENTKFLKQIKIIFLPIVSLLLGYIIFFLPISLIAFYDNFSHIKYIGWGQFNVFEALEPEQNQKPSSGFYQRYIETGFIGAYGLYVVFLPMLFIFIKQIFAKFQRVDYIIATSLLFILFLSDFIWTYDVLIVSFQTILLAYLACFWGNCRFSDVKP